VAACVEHLLGVDLDAAPATASYGVAHILCALSVTNAELRALALAEKDMTPEQFDQLQGERASNQPGLRFIAYFFGSSFVCYVCSIV
jgi:hypothetical protein